MLQVARRRLKAASQDGFALMEVIVSAAVLVIVVLGALAAIDAVTSTAGANKAKTVAAALAERDQEELRGLRTAELDKLKELIPAPREVWVDKVKYTVSSDAQWVTDAQGENISCALTSGDGSFLRITSTVTSNARGVKPVTLTSIVAPQPGSGTLTVIVKDVAGNGVANLGVEATGPSDTKTKTTNDTGCAIFGAVESGAYTIRLDQSPYFSTNCVREALKNANVAAGSLTTVEMLYDRKATGTITVNTVIPPSSTAVNDPSTGVTLAHNGLDAKFCTVPSTAVNSDPLVTDPRLQPTGDLYAAFNVEVFPFTTPYKVYAGRCTWADPARYGAGAAPFSISTPAVTPGGSIGTIAVREPATNLRVTRGGSGSGTNRSGAYIHAYPTGADCNAPSNEIVLGPTQSNGVVQYPGLPFGDYELCADWRSGSSYWKTSSSTTIQNRVATGATTQTRLSISNSTANGRCEDPSPPPPEDGV
jgi:Tfp pilus assembly protein PilV